MQINDRTDLDHETEGEVTLVNLFTPKPGQMDPFIAAQTAEYRRLKGCVEGWSGNHLHVSVDGKAAVNIATFASLGEYRAWREHPEFAEHVDRIRPYVERAEPMLFGPPLYQDVAD